MTTFKSNVVFNGCDSVVNTMRNQFRHITIVKLVHHEILLCPFVSPKELVSAKPCKKKRRCAECTCIRAAVALFAREMTCLTAFTDCFLLHILHSTTFIPRVHVGSNPQTNRSCLNSEFYRTIPDQSLANR